MTTSWKIQWKGHFTLPRKTFKKKCVRLVEEKLKRLLKDTKEDSSKQKDSMFL